ncbi:hypothetical protein [Lysobacter sp. CA199]|uniref:hypothetical protein n=1 Tax=Lysobacter sp. CA199 TaxID=3455608 RepID=UPI003F8D2258
MNTHVDDQMPVQLMTVIHFRQDADQKAEFYIRGDTLWKSPACMAQGLDPLECLVVGTAMVTMLPTPLPAAVFKTQLLASVASEPAPTPVPNATGAGSRSVGILIDLSDDGRVVDFRATVEVDGETMVLSGLSKGEAAALRPLLGQRVEIAIGAVQQAVAGAVEPYGYLREQDGRVQLSIGAERPADRSSGYATPWAPIYSSPPTAHLVRADATQERADA